MVQNKTARTRGLRRKTERFRAPLPLCRVCDFGDLGRVRKRVSRKQAGAVHAYGEERNPILAVTDAAFSSTSLLITLSLSLSLSLRDEYESSSNSPETHVSRPHSASEHRLSGVPAAIARLGRYGRQICILRRVVGCLERQGGGAQGSRQIRVAVTASLSNGSELIGRGLERALAGSARGPRRTRRSGTRVVRIGRVARSRERESRGIARSSLSRDSLERERRGSPFERSVRRVFQGCGVSLESPARCLDVAGDTDVVSRVSTFRDCGDRRRWGYEGHVSTSSQRKVVRALAGKPSLCSQAARTLRDTTVRFLVTTVRFQRPRCGHDGEFKRPLAWSVGPSIEHSIRSYTLEPRDSSTTHTLSRTPTRILNRAHSRPALRVVRHAQPRLDRDRPQRGCRVFEWNLALRSACVRLVSGREDDRASSNAYASAGRR